jgi:hypothetical protein
MPRILMSLLLLLTAHAWAQGPIEIVRAIYGAGRTQVDVTEKVRAAMVNGAIQLTVRGENLGGDPVPNTPKTLTVIYRENGARQTVRVNDFDTLRLGITFRVTKALYGDGRRMKDVTDILNAKVTANRIELAITNANLGGDPAPAVKKAITVDYEFNGAAATVKLAEGETLVLPPASAATPSAPTSGLRILRATYAGANVTNAVAARVTNDTLELPVSTTTLNTDPAPGQIKTLTVEYEFKGQRQTASARDGETLRLNAPAPALKILRATYTGGRRNSADVTTPVAARVANDRLELPVSSTTLNTDPAPGTVKTLTVEYELNGQRQTASARDGETLRLNAPAPALKILRATYQGGRRASADVTNAVAARVAGDTLELTVNGDTLGVDPAPGTVKTLTIEYELNGQRQTATAKDGEAVFLPGVTSFTIYSATYGAQGRTLDATRAVTARLNNNRLELPITGDTLGGDPAPGVVKTLTVDYELNGRRRTATAQDGETLRLPGGSVAASAAAPVLTKAPVVAEVTDAVRPRNTGACLYRQPNYGGEAVCGSSQTALSGGFRSIRLNSATAVEVFDQANFAGRAQTITADTPDLLQLPGSFWRYDSAAMIQSLRAR